MRPWKSSHFSFLHLCLRKTHLGQRSAPISLGHQNSPATAVSASTSFSRASGGVHIALPFCGNGEAGALGELGC